MPIGDGVQQAYKSALGIGKETTWGTAVSVSSYLEFSSESLNGALEAKRLDQVNSQRTPFKRLQGNKSVSGSIEFPLDIGVDAIVNLIKQCLGGTVSSAQVATTGSYTHTLRVGDMESNADSAGSSDMKGLTVEVRKGGDHVWAFMGMRVNQLTISGAVGEPVMGSVELIGKDFTTAASLSTTVSYSTTLPFNFTDITIQHADTLSGSYTATTWQSFELTINNNLVNDLRQLGDRVLGALPVATQDISLNLTQRFDTTTAYGYWTSETARAFKITLNTGDTITTQTGATTYSMRVDLPRAYLDSSAIPNVGSRDDVLSLDQQWTVLHDAGLGYGVQMSINNATAAYS